MEQVRDAHAAFAAAWSQARAAALRDISPDGEAIPLKLLWEANGVAYNAARPLSDRRKGLLATLFGEHLSPLYEDFVAGDPEAVHAVIDFLEVDVLAFHCGYAKEDYLRTLKTTPLNEEHQERLRQYGLGLCSLPAHRREIEEAGRLMIRVADHDFVAGLETLAAGEDERVRQKSVKMLAVVRNGRKDLR